ncbi:Restriction of telomere capping protein 5 [Blastomyces dermatitidis]|uniref:Restriction of telomere capping protein 5 n=3 Tax=Blastomyces TaxID=229219 RepID=RTC5_BLAGS|nr:uncharacterized protein BDBG_02404 [Blastomyces gilchristii SLH14081]XP_045275256.1 uncharacterized protein BDCG_03155 [Blastomyces dermatitidis ER-3]C5GFG2.1 RecName: Full=Restriction of telomere capping protein 5 [Blastomyces dermatitidis ER-3]C5JIS5.1 RecName: Full=Restriction of telomere capping protein 5 [Blastomyces gilchristii SLH14081]EGE79564.1 hypothetical protein BDDG_02505 [Blastomyces dermatitidis ATCC 18188]EQL32927.1 hypothetical protein BDFG_05023 [Blastomyces dermatitidis A
MGGALSTEAQRASSVEELSQRLAHRFATKCFTPLELTHLKDNFFSRALEQRGIRYWNEEILSDFLGIPDGAGSAATATSDGSLDAGPVIFRMVSYLGAFPFQNTMAPTVLTFEAMIKVVVLLTERYGKVLKRGKKDRIKLLFGSLADVGRRDIITQLKEAAEDSLESIGVADPNGGSTFAHNGGFLIDQPINDGEDEDDDDDLALAALESLDAIEVFKQDQRIDKTVFESKISLTTFRRLLTLLIVTAPLRPLGTVSKYTTGLSKSSLDTVHEQVDSILAALGSEVAEDGIGYKSFSELISTSLPYLFDPLTPLFEHLLFSKNLNLSRKSETSNGQADKPAPTPPSTPPRSPPLSPVILTGGFDSCILNPVILSHLSFFISTSPHIPNIFRNRTHLHPVFSSTEHGESLTSFSHHVMTWQAPTILLIRGAVTSENNEEQITTIGAYIPQPWKQSSSYSSRRSSESVHPSTLPCLFEIFPVHTVLQGSPSFSSLKSNMPVSHFSTKTGIAIGCIIPPSSRKSLGSDLHPKPAGGGSLLIDSALENATFVVSDGLNGEGVFLPPGVSPSGTTTTGTTSTKTPSSTSPTASAASVSTSNHNTTKSISIYNLEVWGIIPSQSLATQSDGTGSPIEKQDAIALQRAQWNFEAREAERRQAINMKVGGGESEAQTGRALLEMAGIIGDSQYSAHPHH